MTICAISNMVAFMQKGLKEDSKAYEEYKKIGLTIDSYLMKKFPKEDEKRVYTKELPERVRPIYSYHAFEEECDRQKHWSDRNVERVWNVRTGSHKNFIFNCPDCSHEFVARISNICYRDEWCPYCRGDNLCSDDNCYFCFLKSFASHSRADEWNYIKNNNTPRQICKHSNKEYHMICYNCKHEDEVRISKITGKREYGCAFCSRRRLCENEKCEMCFKHSFASHYRSQFFSKENDISARMFLKCSDKECKFNCDRCKRVFSAKLSNITSGNTWCPFCKNKTAKKLLKFLEKLFEYIKIEQTFEWSKGKRLYRYDFYIELLNLIIELDGGQHFKDVRKWKSSFKEQQKRDRYKEDIALEHGISVIRISQEDVWHDRNDWQNKLKSALKKYDTPTLIKIGKEYNN
jgi:very-short-patch-repair endonuclease